MAWQHILILHHDERGGCLNWAMSRSLDNAKSILAPYPSASFVAPPLFHRFLRLPFAYTS